MADELNAILGFQGQDEADRIFDQFLRDQGREAPAPSGASTPSAVTPPSGGGQPQASAPRGWQALGTYLFEGLQRNYAQLRAAPAGLRAQYHAVAGDPVAEMLAAAEAEHIERYGSADAQAVPANQVPEARWRLQDVTSPEEFSYWLAERFGENSLTLLTSFAGAGAGATVGSLLARGMGGSNALRQAAVRALYMERGAIAGGFASATALETPATGSEMFQTTGSVQPQYSIPAGVLKGALEMWFPSRVLNALTIPGKSLGRSIGTGLAHGLVQEGATETMQEAIDIALRMHVDPNYSFFGDGPYGMGEGAWRLAEAGLAGGLIGAGVGGAAGGIGGRGARTVPDASGLAPGQQATVQEGQAPQAPQVPVQGELSLEPGNPAGMSQMDIVRAYHASPHMFDQVDLTKVGTGEGAQAFGHGFYSAESSNVMKAYQTKFSKADTVKVDGEEVRPPMEARSTMEQLLRNRLQARGLSDAQVISGSIASIETALQASDISVKSRRLLEESLTWLQGIQGKQIEFPGTAHVYEVEHNFEPEQLLDWDRPLGEQGPAVRALSQREDFGFPPPTITGAALMARLRDPAKGEAPAPREVAQALLAAGIPGIRYKDAFSRKAEGAGTYNYVTFDPNATKVLTRNGQPIEAPVHLASVRVQSAPSTREMQAPSTPQVPADEGAAGPVTTLQRLVENGPTLDRGFIESTIPLPQEDLFDVTPLLRSSGMQLQEVEYYLNWLEARTPRYAVLMGDGRFSSSLMNSADYELFSAVSVPQSERLRTWEVDQQSLVPALITADLQDLPAASSKRVWFLQGVEQAKQAELLRDYAALQQQMQAAYPLMLADAGNASFALSALMPAYNKLLSDGLRVIPSRGSSFYYGSGPVRGKEVTVAQTSRAPQWGLYSVRNNTIKKPGFLDSNPATPFGSVVPVGLDMGKFKTGEISILPERGEDGVLPLYPLEGVPEGRKLIVYNDLDAITPYAPFPWTDENIRAFRAMMREGIYIDPKKTQGNHLITLEPLTLDKLIPGVNTAVVNSNLDKPRLEGGLKPHPNVEQELTITGGLTFGQNSRGRQVERILRDAKPMIERLLRSFGIDNMPALVVKDINLMGNAAPGALAQYLHHDYEIRFFLSSSSGWDGWQVYSDDRFPAAVMKTLFHELGHLITIRYYQQLPVEMKQQIDYAYTKALLAGRYSTLEKQGLRFVPDIPALTVQEYFTTKVEWLAEQFRRYALSQDVAVRSELDGALRDIGQNIERFYREIESLVDPQVFQDFSRPDYFFSGWMQYLRDYGVTRWKLKQLERQQSLYTVEEGIYETGSVTMILDQVMRVFESMRHMMPANHPFHLLFSTKLDPKLAGVTRGSLGRLIRGVPHQGITKAMMELAVGSLPPKDPQLYREIFAHELIHAYAYLGLISKEEMNTLYTSAIRENKGLSAAEKASYRKQVAKEGAVKKWDAVYQELIYQDLLREETVAYYVGEYARSGQARPEAKPLLDRILEVLRNIGRAMGLLHYQTRDEILEAFFRGEMVSRAERAQAEAQAEQRFMRVMFNPQSIRVDERKQVDEKYDAIIEYEKDKQGNTDFVTYQYVDRQTGEVVGQQEINVVPGRGFNVHMQFSERPGMALRWLEFVQKELGLPLLGPKMFTLSGFRAATRAFPILKDYYVRAKDPRGGDDHYFSPKYLKEQYEMSKRIVEGQKKYKADGNTLGRGQQSAAMKRMKWYKQQLDKVPKDLWTTNAHYLDQLFMLPRNWHRDEVQGSMIRNGVAAEEAKLQAVVARPPEASTLRDNVEIENERAVVASRQTAAQKAGIDYEQVAQAQPGTRDIRRILHWLDTTGGTTHPSVTRQLQRMNNATQLSQEADRIGHFSSVYWGIRQLMVRNEHLTGLLSYGQRVEQFAGVISAWHRDADDVARIWEQRVRNPRDREQFNGLMYWLAEMGYRTPLEVQTDVIRHPTEAELNAEIARRGLNMPGIVSLADGILWRLYQPPWAVGRHPQNSIFSRFLDSVEQVSIANITRQISDPVQRAQAIAEVQAEINGLRAKPYFPVSRFGQHSITVRDADPLRNNRVLHFSTYESHITRDARVAEIRRQYPLDKIAVGRVPEEFLEFLGLPGPLIAEVRRNMPNITPAQIAWLEQLERQNVPDKAFRARWRPRTGTPGYSMDAFRSFAHYFMHGSRYLARMQFRDSMLRSITSVEDSIPFLANGSKRRMIVDYMRKHYNYIMEGGRDWVKFKSLIAILQLGFSPAAAAMNFTQTPLVSLPWLQGVFGTAQATGQMLRSIKALRNTNRRVVTNAVPGYQRAREEMMRQGRLDIGQAAELGAFAEGNNLLGLLAGTRAQKAYRNFTWASMWMFQRAEQMNREVMLHAVWEIGHRQYATNERVREIQLHYFQEIAELQNRTGMSAQDAVVFVLAKEALDQTQGLYAPYARPAFIRGPLAGTFLIFYQFTQMMTYAFRYNPGQVQLLLVTMAVYGLAGLPGSEDAAELLRWLSLLAKRLFGTGEFDLMTEVRRYVRGITRGTFLDEIGPDLFLHGVSRWGFGLGLLPRAGALAQFDASANGSLGKLVPGLYEALHAVNTSAKFDQFVADVAQRTAGAGFGWFLSLSQFFMNSPGSVDSHKWEQALPRVLRAIAAGFRYLPAELNPWQPQTMVGLPESVGAATTPSGARIATFSATDPEDLAAVAWQFLGFRPNQVSMAQERRRERIELIQIFGARRSTLMAQFTAAMLSGQQGTIDTVYRAIERFNAEVADAEMPRVGISAEQLRQSTRNRERARLLEEAGQTTQRMYQEPTGRLNDLFPGIRPKAVQ